MSEEARKMERGVQASESSLDAPGYRDILVEPMDLAEITSISDERSFYDLLLPQRRIVLATRESLGRRRDAAALAMALYRLRLNYLSARNDLDGIRETMEHYNGWSHHLERILQTRDSGQNLNLLKMSPGDVSELEDTARMVSDCDRLLDEADADSMSLEYEAKMAAVWGRLNESWLSQEKGVGTQRNVADLRRSMSRPQQQDRQGD